MSSGTVTFGEIMLRLASPGCERLLQTPQLVATFGGGEANVAASLAGFGLPAAFVTVLPEANPIGDAAIGELRRFGVDTSRIVRGPGRMGLYFLETGASQRPSRVVYDRQDSAFARASPERIPWNAALAGASWLHVTGITPAVSESASAMVLAGAEEARALGLTVSCDLNYRRNLWKWGKLAASVMPGLARLADVLIANEEDIQMSLDIGADVGVPGGPLNPESYRGLAEAVLAEYRNLKIVAITLRESRSASHNGWSACIADGRQFLVSQRYDIEPVVDRVGTGDSFAAGLIYARQTGRGLQDAVEFAVAASCLKHSVPGDLNRVSVADVQALLDGGGSGRVQR